MAEFNLFEHHHDHGHDPEPIEPESLDPAQRSLADALRVSFLILKVIMVSLLVYYVFISGVFNVKSNELAVRMRFGKILKDNQGNQILATGGPYFALPYPFEEHIIVQTTPIELKLDRDFWYSLSPEEAQVPPDRVSSIKVDGLDPTKDGSMLTGDASIVHAQWTVLYMVQNPVDYLENVGDSQKARQLIRNAADEGVIYAVAQASADDVVNGKIDRTEAKLHMQAALDGMHSGLLIKDLTADKTSMPPPVIEAYKAVAGALGDKGQRIDAARQEQSRILGAAAGEGASQVLEVVNEYENAVRLKQTDKVEALNKRLDDAFYTLQIPSPDGVKRIGGDVAKLINDAKTYRSQIVDQLSSEASRFNELLPQYNAHPQIVLNRLWADARETIFTGDVESIYLPRDAQIYLETNRDPKIQSERDRQRLLDEQQKNRDASNRANNP